MKLRYILGIPGSGKTTLCINEAIKAAEEGTTALYFVPEQFSLESERLFCSASQNRVLINSEVLSFAHLAHRMLSKTGAHNKKILDENGKILLLKKTVNDLVKSKGLSFYGKSAIHNGFISNISSLITELVRCSASPELLEEKAESFKEDNIFLYEKLKDIIKIYTEYNKGIADRYISGDTLLDVLAEKIPQSPQFKGCEVWIDSFTDFTPQEFRVIEALLKSCKRVNISLTLQSPYEKSSVLSTFDPCFDAKRSISRINRIADSLGAKEEKGVFLSEDLRHTASPELEHLTKYYFSGKSYSGDNGSVKIFSADSLEEELNKTAAEVLALLQSPHEDYSCSDIAVLVSSEEYYLPLRDIFDKYNIPCFTDFRRDILFHPLTRLIQSIFGIANGGAFPEQVFKLLKTGFNDLTPEEICLAENYCIACGIKGKRWYKEWEYLPSPANVYKDSLNDLNDIRSYICDILDNINMLKAKRGSTVREISIGVYRLFDYFGVKEGLSSLINKAEEIGDQAAARIHKQMWDIIGSLFSKMCEIMGDEKISLRDYEKIIGAGLESATIGLIPATCESVTIAQFNRSRLPNVKALFMLGVNEGVIPPYHNDSNLLSDSDRAYLAADGMELGGDTLRLINRDRYNIYSYIAKPSERLYLSYNTGLEESMRSPVISDICSRLNIEPRKAALSDNDSSGIFSREQAFELLLHHLSELERGQAVSPLYEAVYAHLAENEEYSERLKAVEGWLNFADPSTEELNEELAKELYLAENDSLISGITSLQSYAQCPYMYFMEHGLKALEREEYEASSLDMGTFLHNMLKSFSDKVQKEKGWENVNDEYINSTVEQIAEEAMEGCKAGLFADSPLDRYTGAALTEAAKSTIKALSQGIEGFVPQGYEITFGPDESTQLPPLTYSLNESTCLVLTGSIDRADLFTDSENNTYVKITDYKSSKRDGAIFSQEQLFLGVQLQLPLYMEAYTQSKPEAKPGGFFYFKISNPIFKTDNPNAFSSLMAGGMAVDKPSVLEALNETEQRSLKNARSKAYVTITEDGLSKLTDHVNKIITDIGSGIIKGNIAAHPYITAKKATACGFCPYSAVCCFELCPNKRDKYRRAEIDNWEELINDTE